MLLKSKAGYYWQAIRENEEAAQALGINTFRWKMLAVVISSAMTAVSGVFFAFYYNNLFPEQIFHISRSIEIILGPIIGGVGTLFGPILGAAVLTLLSDGITEVLAALGWEIPGIKQVFYGVVLLLVIMFLPHGIWPPLAQQAGLWRSEPARRVEGISKSFRGLKAVSNASLRGAAGRHHRADRPERRRQDHQLQHDRRRVRAGHRRDPLRRNSRSRACGRTRSAPPASAAPSRSSSPSPACRCWTT